MIKWLKRVFCKHKYIEKYEHYGEYWLECEKCKHQITLIG